MVDFCSGRWVAFIVRDWVNLFGTRISARCLMEFPLSYYGSSFSIGNPSGAWENKSGMRTSKGFESLMVFVGSGVRWG